MAALRATVLLLAVLFLSGPGVLLPFDVMGHGLTRSTVSYFASFAAVYLLWTTAFWLREVLDRRLAWAEIAGLFLIGFFALGAGSMVRDLPGVFQLPGGPSFKEDSLQAILILTFLPWLVVQSILFAIFWLRRPTVPDGVTAT